MGRERDFALPSPLGRTPLPISLPTLPSPPPPPMLARAVGAAARASSCSSSVVAARCSSSAASSTAAATPGGPAEQAAAKAVERIRQLFHDPVTAARLTTRQRQVFETPEDLPSLPPVEDHGYLYGFTGEHLAGASESVRRALSTRTANIAGALTFRRSELRRKLAPDAFNTGAPVVQVCVGGMMCTARWSGAAFACPCGLVQLATSPLRHRITHATPPCP